MSHFPKPGSVPYTTAPAMSSAAKISPVVMLRTERSSRRTRKSSMGVCTLNSPRSMSVRTRSARPGRPMATWKIFVASARIVWKVPPSPPSSEMSLVA